MKKFRNNFSSVDYILSEKHNPNFENLLKILRCETASEPVLFEFFLNGNLYRKLLKDQYDEKQEKLSHYINIIKSYNNAGYDYATVLASDFGFPSARHANTGAKSISLNEGAMITDRDSFECYPWPDPRKAGYFYEELSPYLPEGMKLIAYGPGGVLENVIMIVGYEQLCFLLADDPGLVSEIFDAVGSRLVKYYEICASFENVGALISNDDWGFNTQTMLSTENMRKYVFPWHKKIVETIHKSGKPAILHSCGQLENVMEDIIEDMKFDGKHSYEDNILPVEQAYEKWGGRIAILGGIDVNYLCSSTPEEIYERSCAMLNKASKKGGYALGSGNSIPAYVPEESYFAMIAAAK